jgi:hypothetical protein
MLRIESGRELRAASTYSDPIDTFQVSLKQAGSRACELDFCIQIKWWGKETNFPTSEIMDWRVKAPQQREKQITGQTEIQNDGWMLKASFGSLGEQTPVWPHPPVY